MRAFVTIFTVIAILLVTVGNAEAGRSKYRYDYEWDDDWDDWDDDAAISIDMKHNSVTITCNERGHRGEMIEITEDYELYINDERIATDSDQTELLKEFHKNVVFIKSYAYEIGKEGAKIGVSGAALGIKAVASVFKLISPNYDTDDLEEDVEREAEKIEARAEKLEKKAERLEDMADDILYLLDEMVEEISEVGELEWI